MASGKLQRIWLGIINRCYNESSKDFANYGGRGVRMCDEWRDSFTAFAADVGEPPEGHSLDRVDNHNSYLPGNCRWATSIEQNNNTRHNRRLIFQGRSRTIAQWARELGFRPGAIWARLNKGWTVEEALTHPFRTKGKHVTNLHVNHDIASAAARNAANARWKKK